MTGVYHVVSTLTARQRQVLAILRAYRVENGEPPTQRLLARRLGVNVQAVQDLLAGLYRRGWLASPTPGGLICEHDSSEILSQQHE